MTTHPRQREILSMCAESAAGIAPILRVAGSGATSRFHTLRHEGEGSEAWETALNHLRRKRLNAGKLRFRGAIDLLPARRLLYKSPRETEVARC